MSNKFCRQLSNGYKINVSWQGLEWSPCCYYSKKILMSNQLEFEKELKRTSEATTWLPECRQCRQMENSGAAGLAPRLQSFNKIHTELENGACAALEINVDLMCNAACLSCGSYASTTWQKYETKHKLNNINSTVDKANEYFDQLIATVPLDQLQSLYILGGEPFYGLTNLKILKHLHQVHPALHTVELQYQTNGSLIPDSETLELWKGFKKVIFGMSLDGVGERFNYLRWPLKWHRVERTVEFLLKNSAAIFSVNATINPLSIWYFDEIEKWTLDFIPVDRMISRVHHPVRANRCMPPMDLNLTPMKLRNDIVLKYGADHKLSKIFSNLELRRDLQPMFEYINKHDQLRRLSWRKVFPDMVDYYPDA